MGKEGRGRGDFGYPFSALSQCPSVIDPVVGKPPRNIPADSPPINCGPLTSQMIARLARSGERQILFIVSDWKRGNSDSWAIRLWEERTSCGG